MVARRNKRLYSTSVGMEMEQNWSQSVHKIVLLSGASNARVIGITGAEANSGVTLLSKAVAELFFLSGYRSLLVEVDGGRDSIVPDWYPEGGLSKIGIRADEAGFDHIGAQLPRASRFAFNNPAYLGWLFNEDLSEYERLILDLPPVSSDDSRMNPAALCAACDSVYLVCAGGRLSEDKLKVAVDLIGAAGGSITGVVFNEFHNDTPGRDLARISRKIFRAWPDVAERLAHQALSSRFLNP
jgi:hypothetical protein